MRILQPLLAAAAALALVAGAADAGTLKTVQDRGKLVCGVSTGVAGFSIKDDKGEWSGFDVDFCRALAAAIFNDPAKVEFVPLNATERFDALKSGKIDVLSRNSTWTLGREEESNVAFAGVTYYDGQSFMLPKARKASSAMELDSVKVCVQKGTTSEPNAKDFLTANHVTFEIVESDTVADMVSAYLAGKCDVLSTDQSALFALRSQFPKPSDHAILPDMISKEPLGPVVRQDDMQWLSLVKWMTFALLDAEEAGVSSQTIDEALQSQKPAVKRIVGAEGDFGKGLGVDNGWVVNAVRSVGNYGEIFERNVGVHTKLGIPRGLNELWNNGGIQYAPPIR